MSKPKILNFNVGVLGHVDCGKTTLTKALSQVVSTSSLDKNPQSQARGITLDLGFSAFFTDVPPQYKDSGFDKLQITLVDCPGHASLIKTIIGGAQIIDMMLLVVDVTKGIQTQTAECLVIGEILTDNLIVVLNKMDMLKDKKVLESIKKKLRMVFKSTKFGQDVPMVAVSANPGGQSVLKKNVEKAKTDLEEGAVLTSTPQVKDLLDVLMSKIRLPDRHTSGNFYFLIDHCFGIQGRGTILTGTVLRGSIGVNDVLEFPSLGVQKKVKSMQMFRKPVSSCRKGDRVGICVTQFDASLLERGIACTPGSIKPFNSFIAQVEKIRFYKEKVKTKAKFHVTIGHQTVMATCTFFTSHYSSNSASSQASSPSSEISQPMANVSLDKQEEEKKDTLFDIDREYLYMDELSLSGDIKKTAKAPRDQALPRGTQYCLIEFEKPVLCQKGTKLIGSKLDSDVHGSACRIAFEGQMLVHIPWNDPKDKEHLKIFKTKQRLGSVDRVMNDTTIICKDLFQKETDMTPFIGLHVELESGESGIIEGNFGQGGKCKINFRGGFAKAEAASNAKAPSSAPSNDKKRKKEKRKISSKVILSFKKFVFATNKKAMVQK